jgi:hypothetical protein
MQHPIELFSIVIGSVICACVSAIAFAFIVGAVADIIQF